MCIIGVGGWVEFFGTHSYNQEESGQGPSG
uniref:Uncharacterized protein n=1 Tax=Anguilla anguilla TaxID=7936 RepID=A0A0E9PED2_ANGAN